ncbi:hypothetical protein I7I50_00809 [Histoplasma capsulatum G186AR]|uniref:Uncharacterized protein n=1 Tax=Ajellomyces capsulatus TaxID=5037 RepID=A0A8H8CV32_AJECA|nr:hypothetical protein I7I52_08077 [Histoplasma capsulatum]QSS72839.1 hypothetical protein I7I50_00809 [Histoplasma capsulatum G186AR]
MMPARKGIKYFNDFCHLTKIDVVPVKEQLRILVQDREATGLAKFTGMTGKNSKAWHAAVRQKRAVK